MGSATETGAKPHPLPQSNTDEFSQKKKSHKIVKLLRNILHPKKFSKSAKRNSHLNNEAKAVEVKNIEADTSQKHKTAALGRIDNLYSQRSQVLHKFYEQVSEAKCGLDERTETSDEDVVESDFVVKSVQSKRGAEEGSPHRLDTQTSDDSGYTTDLIRRIQSDVSAQDTLEDGDDDTKSPKTYTEKVTNERSPSKDTELLADSLKTLKIMSVGPENDKNSHDVSKGLVTDLKNLNINTESKPASPSHDDHKKTVYVRRAPIRKKLNCASDFQPYTQINQINKVAFSGGHVIVNDVATQFPVPTPTYHQPEVQNHWSDQTASLSFYDDHEKELKIKEIVRKLSDGTLPETEARNVDEWSETVNLLLDVVSKDKALEDAIEHEFSLNFHQTSNHNGFGSYDTHQSQKDCFESDLDCFLYDKMASPNGSVGQNLFSQMPMTPQNDASQYSPSLERLTPPRSNESSLHSIPSPRQVNFSYATPPYGDSVSNYTSSSPQSDFTVFSPERCSPHPGGAPAGCTEQSYQFDTSAFELNVAALPQVVLDADVRSVSGADRAPAEGQGSKVAEPKCRRTSSINMSVIKKRLEAIRLKYASKSCCQKVRPACRELFKEYINKFSMEERKKICIQVTTMDLNILPGILQSILANLRSETTEYESINFVLFNLICERLLVERPLIFLQELGLRLLTEATLRCHARPLLVRYLVQCIGHATRTPQGKVIAENTPYLFTETDARGDNLIGACARAGDACGDALAELLRAGCAPPLFHAQHFNTDGYCALHLACLAHGAPEAGEREGGAGEGEGRRRSCAHALHVLLAHAAADPAVQDNKGGNTPLHLAVDSAGCDLELLLTMFQQLPRHSWRQFAHAHNYSQVTPLELARAATKSVRRSVYPKEVLDFLKKCR